MGPVLKMLLIFSLLLLVPLSSCTTPGFTPGFLQPTVISGSGPVPKNPAYMRPLEAIGTRLGFLEGCGSPANRPTCTCANGDQWRHPYWIALCQDGGSSTCVCPNGEPFQP